jgi:hypothetical protein
VMAYTRPDGLCPAIGDSDDGRVHVFTEGTRSQPRDHRYLLSLGAAVFGRPDLAQAAGDLHEETIWALGDGAREAFASALAAEPQRERGSAAFPEAGLYVMRHSELYLMVHAGPTGTRGRGAHSHNDALSFELCVGDAPIVVDPGTYCYAMDPQARNLFRSTAYHSTVVVDGQEISRFDRERLFALVDESEPQVAEWRSTPAMDLLVAQHHGYRRLAQPVVHRRTFRLDKGTRGLRIEDELRGEGVHRIDWRLHLAAGCQVEIGASGTEPSGRNAGSVCGEGASDTHHTLAVSSPSGVGVRIIVESSQPLRAQTLDTWRSPRYGLREGAATIALSGRASTPLRIVAEFHVARASTASG